MSRVLNALPSLPVTPRHAFPITIPKLSTRQHEVSHEARYGTQGLETLLCNGSVDPSILVSFFPSMIDQAAACCG